MGLGFCWGGSGNLRSKRGSGPKSKTIGRPSFTEALPAGKMNHVSYYHVIWIDSTASRRGVPGESTTSRQRSSLESAMF
eukprot:1788478-Pyramimonas_sp.AAC.1